MEIEIYSDVVCPWCYLGKTRLEAALRSHDGEVILRWRAFQLDPDAPSDGRPLLDWLAPRFGGAQRARQMLSHVTATAEAEGLHLDFDRALIANTFDAHRLLWFADQPEAVLFGAGAETQPELADVLYRAHLSEGLDVGSHEELIRLAGRVGLEEGRIADLLGSTEGTADVRGQIARAHDLGITSVPTFIFAGKYAVTGAQEANTLRSVLGDVLEREGMSSTLTAFIPGQRTEPAADDDSRVS